MLSAEEVAAGIVDCAERPRREVTFGRAGRALEVLYSLSPALYRRFAHSAFVDGTIAPLPQGDAAGNVLRPTALHAVEAGWKRRHRPVLRRALRDATVGGVLGLLGRSPRRERLAQDPKNRRGRDNRSRRRAAVAALPPAPPCRPPPGWAEAEAR